MARDTQDFRLPTGVIGVMDVGRLSRELRSIDEFVVQASVRDAGKQPALPRTSHNLNTLAQENEFNLLLDVDRQQLSAFLQAVRLQAPVLHMSFASDPSAGFLQKLVTWLRAEIHPLVLLQVGRQPGLAAGCIVRTPNHYFDLSLRKQFAQSEKLLVDALRRGETDDVG